MTDNKIADMRKLKKVVVESQPRFLEIKDARLDECPRCCTKLEEKIKQGREEIYECGRCRYMDRPFGWCSTDLGSCECEYEDIDIIVKTCPECSVVKCSICSSVIGVVTDMRDFSGEEAIVCSKCEFRQKWKKATVKEKLAMHGVMKLKILAEKKQIKEFTKLKKNELIESLVDQTTDNDFPIR